MISSKYTLGFYEQKIANFEHKSNWSFEGLPLKHNFIFDKMSIISKLRKLTKGLCKPSCSHDDWIKEIVRANKRFSKSATLKSLNFQRQTMSFLNKWDAHFDFCLMVTEPTKSIHLEKASFKHFSLTISAYKFFNFLL